MRMKGGECERTLELDEVAGSMSSAMTLVAFALASRAWKSESGCLGGVETLYGGTMMKWIAERRG